MTSSLSMILLNVSVEIIHKIRRLWFGPHTLDNKLSGVFSLMNGDNTFWVSLFCKPQKEKKNSEGNLKTLGGDANTITYQALLISLY